MAELPFQIAELPFQMPELPFQMPELPFQMPEFPLQVEELAFLMAEFDFQAALHITQCNCIFMFSAPTSVSRYSETGSEQALEARLKEVLDAQIALKETVDKAMVRQKYFMMYCMERHVLHGFALRS